MSQNVVKYEERLIGFDAREMRDFAARGVGLLRLDLRKVLSTERMVWPSVFDITKADGFDDLEILASGLAGVQLPTWVGPNEPLWSNLDQLREYVTKKWIANRLPYWIICVIRVMHEGLPPPRNPYWPFLGTTTPAERSDGWRLLGYDVSDNSLLSGLSACGYTDDAELLRERKAWGKHLNEYHLFDSLERAVEFRAMIDDCCEEDPPFYVHGLWLIEQGE